MRIRPVALLVALSAFNIAPAQTPSPVASISVQSYGKAAIVLSEADLAQMPQHTVKLKEHDKESTYTGASLHDLLVKAGAPTGNRLHGTALSSFVLVTGMDGYEAVFTLTEADPTYTDDEVVLADRVDGAPLPETQGPFRIIPLHDKKLARSVRMVTKIEVIQLRH